MRNVARLFCVCSLLVSYSLLDVPAARADSAPTVFDGLDGSNMVPIRNDEISMVREVVDIDCRWTEFSVKADFWFRNTTDHKQKVLMGFPIDYASNEDEIVPVALKTFRVQWRHRRVRPSFAKVDSKDIWTHRQWVYWSVEFKPKEEVHHRVSYTFPTWTSSSGEHENYPYAYLNYIVRSGAAWKGPITSAVVRVHYGHSLKQLDEHDASDYGREPKPSDLGIYPEGYVLNKKRKTVTWAFKDFEPDRDVYFGWGTVPDFKDVDEQRRMTFKDFPMNPKEMPAVSRPQAKNP